MPALKVSPHLMSANSYLGICPMNANENTRYQIHTSNPDRETVNLDESRLKILSTQARSGLAANLFKKPLKMTKSGKNAALVDLHNSHPYCAGRILTILAQATMGVSTI